MTHQSHGLKVAVMIGFHDRSEKTISVDSSLSSGMLTSQITVSKSLRKYFRNLSFFSSYDADIVANTSILDIPVLSIVLPLAWITGADVWVDELDRTFGASMEALQQEYRRMYPAGPFMTKLVADKLFDNKHASEKAALLFSGGLDATYSLFSNMNLKPILIMILGTVDIPISNISFQKTLVREYSDFARRESLDLHFIRTNALEILDRRRIDHFFSKFQGRLEGDFWRGIGYSVGHIGQTAPFSIGRFNRLLVAGAYDQTQAAQMKAYPDASYPDTDEKIRWASAYVIHDGRVPRHHKAFALRKILNAHRLKLRPCWNASDLCLPPQQPSNLSDAINCNMCAKCLRTIAELTLAAIDPNECGFSVDRLTFNRMRAMIERRMLSHQDIALWWRPLQQAIPNEIEGLSYDAKQFFEWFKTMDLDSLAGGPRSILSTFYFLLPYELASFFRKLWEMTPNKDLLAEFLRLPSRSTTASQL
jgi:hypothetical protein